MSKEKDLSKPLKEFKWQVDLLYDGRRLDKFVHHKSPWRSRNIVQNIIREDKVLVNGEVAKANYRLRKGDIVVAKLDIPDVDLSEIVVDVIYEDDYLLCVNKQPGILVHPAGKRLFGTLINAIHAKYKDEPEVQPMLCHRLDEFTSGALLLAKNSNVKRYIQRRFEANEVDKAYLAIVEGDVPDDGGEVAVTVGAFRGEAPDYRTRMAANVEWGQKAKTEYVVEERFRSHTLVKCILHTGRTHQIRVHMNHIGHPVLCDDVYTGRELVSRADLGLEGAEPVLERQALHSWTLSFIHPVTEERLTIEAPLAEDISRTLELLRGRCADEEKHVERT